VLRWLNRIKRPGNRFLDRVLNAGFWAFALRVIMRFLVIVRTVILARLLVPDDFGIMAIAILVILLLESFTDTGFNAALVQRSDDIRPYLNTAWTLAVARGVVSALVLILSAHPIALFFDNAEVEPILMAVAGGVFVKGFSNIGAVEFERDLRFDRRFVIEASGRASDFVVAVGAALILRSVWALALGYAAGVVTQVVTSYVIHPYRPRLSWNRLYARELFAFGKWVLGARVLIFFIGNLDDVMVGRMLTVASLGLYRMAWNLSQAVATELSQVTSQVAFPAYSQLKDEPARLRSAYFEALHLVSFLAFPLAIGTALVAHDLTVALLGSQWVEMVPAMRILSLAGLVRAVTATAGPLLQARGRPDLVAKISAVRLAILASVLYPAITVGGLAGAAWATVIAGLLTSSLSLNLATRPLNPRRSDIVRSLAIPASNAHRNRPPQLRRSGGDFDEAPGLRRVQVRHRPTPI
jgi:O-antigen/teichoic acid export membrane protein